MQVRKVVDVSTLLSFVCLVGIVLLVGIRDIQNIRRLQEVVGSWASDHVLG